MTRANGLAIESNLSGHVSFIARHTAGMRVDDSTDLLVVESGLPSDTFNIVCRARMTSATADQRIADTIVQFQKDGRHRASFSWWVGPNCRPGDLGLRLGRFDMRDGEIEVGMSVDLGRLRLPPMPDGVVIRRASTAVEVAHYASVLAGLSDPPDRSFVEYYRRGAHAILRPGSPIRLYMAYVDDVPVAGSELFLDAGVAGVYGVATLAGARRGGIGSVMTAVPLQDARREGARIGILQASPDGAALYARLGFEAGDPFAVFQYSAPV